MIVLAALCAACAVYLGWETLAGRALKPRRVPRSPKRRPRPSRQVWLSQAGAAVTPGQFWATCVGIAAVAFVVLYALDSTLVVALGPAVGIGAVPYLYWSAQRRKRANARVEAWPDGIRQVAGSLNAGIATLHAALVHLSVAGPEPLRAPMGRYVRLADRVGQHEALEAVRAELADPVSDAVLLTFEMAAGEGTRTVLEVLDGLQRQISGDLALGEKIRTLQTQSRIAAVGCAVVPYGLLVFLCATTVFFRSFYQSPAGLLVVCFGGVCSLVGYSIVRRLGRPIATVDRVFVPAERRS